MGCSIFQYFGVNPEQTPAVRLIDLYGMFRYKLNGKVTEQSIINFLKGYNDGTIKVIFCEYAPMYSWPHIMPLQRQGKTQVTPADWDAKPVKVLTGDNFEEVVSSLTHDTFIEFCK